MLKIEDLKYRDILVHKETGIEYEVMGFDNNEIIFSSGEVANDLKYFKKKEQSQQYTFDDLIDVAVQAYKDDVTKSITLVDGVLCVSEDRLSDAIVAVGDKASSQFYSDAINAIQSLYKETFVIETEEDVRKIKDDCDRITLSNGELMPKKVFRQLVHDYTYHIAFKVLKGATVTQSK